MRHMRGRTRFCGGRRLQPQCGRCLIQARGVKGGYKGEDASEQIMFDIDKGWAPNAKELAEQIQSAIEETQGLDDSAPGEVENSGEIVFSTSWEVSCAVVILCAFNSALPLAVHSSIGAADLT